MDNKDFDVKKFGLEFRQQLTNDYIDFLYYTYDCDVESVKEMLVLAQKGNENSIVSTFNYVAETHEMTKKEIHYIVQTFINECVYDFDIYVSDVISAYTKARYEITNNDKRLSVKNRYGDVLYYNSARLEYLRKYYGKIKDKHIKDEIKRAKTDADLERNVYKRQGIILAPNYSFLNHIEYRYYIEKFIKEFNIDEEYEIYRNQNQHEYVDFTTGKLKYSDVMSKIEYVQSKIDQMILAENKTRKRK